MSPDYPGLPQKRIIDAAGAVHSETRDAVSGLVGVRHLPRPRPCQQAARGAHGAKAEIKAINKSHKQERPAKAGLSCFNVVATYPATPLCLMALQSLDREPLDCPLSYFSLSDYAP